MCTPTLISTSNRRDNQASIDSCHAFGRFSRFYDLASKLKILHFPFVNFAAQDFVEDELRINDITCAERSSMDMETTTTAAGIDDGMQVASEPH